MSDRFRLSRFQTAQDRDGTYSGAVSELQAGLKRSHWMWFIFPQIAGLGQSSMSRTYAITSLAEAQAYLRHPVLGARLIECVRILTAIEGRTAEDILGALDAAKLRSSMTLFLHAAPNEQAFQQLLKQYFDGVEDSITRSILEAEGQALP